MACGPHPTTVSISDTYRKIHVNNHTKKGTRNVCYFKVIRIEIQWRPGRVLSCVLHT